MSAVSVFCLAMAGGCASMPGFGSQAATSTTPAKQAEAQKVADSDTPATAKNSVAPGTAKDLPATLDGEIKRAQQLRLTGDYDEAIRSLAQLMLFAPDDARIVGEYGKVLEQQGHSTEALAYLKRAAELQPGDWSLHSALGVAYDQLDDHASARLAYDRALSLKPGEGSVLNNYGVSRMLAGDYTGARRLFAQAAAAGSPNPKIALNLDKLSDLSAPAPSLVSAAPTGIAATAAPSPASGGRPPLYVAVQTAAAPKVVMQQMPAAPIAPHTSATRAGSAAKNVQTPPVATTAPKTLGPQVVMQRVPADPLAGRVVAHTPHKLAAAKQTQLQAPKAADTTPSLRTAADAN